MVSESTEDTDGDDMETFLCLSNNEEESHCSNGDESKDDTKSLLSADPSSEDREYDDSLPGGEESFSSLSHDDGDREKLRKDDAHTPRETTSR